MAQKKAEDDNLRMALSQVSAEQHPVSDPNCGTVITISADTTATDRCQLSSCTRPKRGELIFSATRSLAGTPPLFAFLFCYLALYLIGRLTLRAYCSTASK